jgi:hypothetical protein
MSRAASPVVKVGLLLAVLLAAGAKARASDVPACTREIQRCLSACRAVCARRITGNEREAKRRTRPSAHFFTTPQAMRPPAFPAGSLT